jgi:hypothetical protein
VVVLRRGLSAAGLGSGNVGPGPAVRAQAGDRGGGGQGERGMDLGFGNGPVREAGVAGQPPPFVHVHGAHREVGWPRLPGLPWLGWRRC